MVFNTQLEILGSRWREHTKVGDLASILLICSHFNIKLHVTLSRVFKIILPLRVNTHHHERAAFRFAVSPHPTLKRLLSDPAYPDRLVGLTSRGRIGRCKLAPVDHSREFLIDELLGPLNARQAAAVICGHGAPTATHVHVVVSPTCHVVTTSVIATPSTGLVITRLHGSGVLLDHWLLMMLVVLILIACVVTLSSGTHQVALISP